MYKSSADLGVTLSVIEVCAALGFPHFWYKTRWSKSMKASCRIDFKRNQSCGVLAGTLLSPASNSDACHDTVIYTVWSGE